MAALIFVDVAHRDVIVALAEVQHQRHLGTLVEHLGDIAPVVADRRRHAGNVAGRSKGERAAPAIAHDADLAALGGGGHGSRDVEHRLLGRDLAHIADAGLDVGRT